MSGTTFQDPPHVTQGHPWVTCGNAVLAKCVFFTCVGTHKSEEHNSENENDYYRKTQGKGHLKPPYAAEG